MDSRKIVIKDHVSGWLQQIALRVPAIVGKIVAKLAAMARNAIIRGDSAAGTKKCPVGKGYNVRWDGSKSVFVKHSGGQLRNSIIREVHGDTATVGSPLKYAPFILGDTPPFPIRPVKKKFLMFATPGKQVVFSKGVTHPGGKKLTGGSFTLAARYAEKKAPIVAKEIMRKAGFNF